MRLSGEYREPRLVVGSIVLILLTTIAYLPTFHAGFIWDDDTHLLKNLITQPGGLVRSWFTTEQPNYWPLTWSAFWLQWQVWGADATGYHAVSVTIHILNAFLVWHLLAKLEIAGAWIGALIFAVHPVNVETVAWVTQQKNLISMFFYLLSILFFLASEKKKPGFYALSVTAFVLGLIAKTGIVMLPVVLMILTYWFHGKISRKRWWRIVPFFAISAIFGVVEIWFQTTRAIGTDIVRTDGFWGRLAVAGTAVWFYLGKAIFPFNLMFVYPRWELDSHSVWSYVPVVALVLLFWFLWVLKKTWSTAAMFGLGYFVVMLLPILGFGSAYFMRYSLVADHWQYFAIVGAIVTAVNLVIVTGKLALPRFERLVAPLAVGLAIGFSFLSYKQAAIYLNEETLWRDTLGKNQEAWIAYNQLGLYLSNHGRISEAKALYESAVRINPSFIGAQLNLALLLIGGGQLAAGKQQLESALTFSPNAKELHATLGAILGSEGNYHESIRYLSRALEIDPGFEEARRNLAVARKIMEESK